jgi:hypothetical protein
MEATPNRAHCSVMTSSRLLLVLPLALLGACAAEHAACALPDAAPTDARAPCPFPLVDEGDACVGWRAIPPPPCIPGTVLLCGAEVAVTCDDLLVQYGLDASYTWQPLSDATTLVVQEDDGPEESPAPRLVVTLADGRRVAAHGDVYAAPAAWRTDAAGAWRETVPPPSTFFTHSAALSENEALFVGSVAYVFTWLPR